VNAEIIPFNPLDKKNLGVSIAIAMLTRPVCRLDDLPRFDGAGIYAIYYTGGFQAYRKLVEYNKDSSMPIYVGKAVPAGARKGGGLAAGQIGQPLYNRLNEHVDSIRSASETLDIKDFSCRYLVVDDIWIPLGESLLIARFAPIWNTLIDGFGNHDPGRGRYGGMRPRWDVLHPGRAWALRCQERQEDAEEIKRDIETYLNALQPSRANWLDFFKNKTDGP
jgi:hypothetical protein